MGPVPYCGFLDNAKCYVNIISFCIYFSFCGILSVQYAETSSKENEMCISHNSISLI